MCHNQRSIDLNLRAVLITLRVERFAFLGDFLGDLRAAERLRLGAAWATTEGAFMFLGDIMRAICNVYFCLSRISRIHLLFSFSIFIFSCSSILFLFRSFFYMFNFYFPFLKYFLFFILFLFYFSFHFCVSISFVFLFQSFNYI